MKSGYWIAALVLVAGIYLEYQKDSSFSSTDSGSLIIGGGLGLAVGCAIF